MMWKRAFRQEPIDPRQLETEKQMNHRTDIDQSVRSAATLPNCHPCRPSLKSQQPGRNRQTIKTGRQQKANVKKSQTETNREKHRDKGNQNQQDNQLNQPLQSDHQIIPLSQGYVKPLKQKKFALLLKKQLEQHLQQQGSAKPLVGVRVLRR